MNVTMNFAPREITKRLKVNKVEVIFALLIRPKLCPITNEQLQAVVQFCAKISYRNCRIIVSEITKIRLN